MSLLLGMAFLVLAVVTTTIPGLVKLPGASATTDVACTVQYLALDPNDATKPMPGKESDGSFGLPVVARDIPGIMKELDNRRECAGDTKYDPALAADHYYTWSVAGLTSIKVSMAEDGLEKFKAQWIADKSLRSKALAELKQLEKESTKSLEDVGHGIPSLYMVPDRAGGVITKLGTTAGDKGTNLVFTHGDVVVRYRLDCGFQPNWPTGTIPNLPACAEGECTPPPPPVIPPTPECTENCNPQPPVCNPEWEKCWETSKPAPDGVNVQPNDDYESPESVATPASPAPVISGNENQTSTGQAPGGTAPDPNRNQPDPGTGTTSDGGTGSVNPDNGGGTNTTDSGNPFG